MGSWADMRHDMDRLGEMTRRERLASWLRFYFRPTRRWVDGLVTWRDGRRFGPLPPIERDKVARHFGFVDGVPPCTELPECAEHGWSPSPFGSPSKEDPDA